MNWQIESQHERREAFFAKTRDQIHTVVNPDGSGKIPQFNPPSREPAWILPALYTGAQSFIDLANRMVARYHDGPVIRKKACQSIRYLPN